jgi:hypothetical protein
MVSPNHDPNPFRGWAALFAQSFYQIARNQSHQFQQSHATLFAPLALFVCCLFDQHGAASAFLKIDFASAPGAKIAWPRPRNTPSQIHFKNLAIPCL